MVPEGEVTNVGDARLGISDGAAQRPTTDQRTLTRRSKEKARRKRMIEAREHRLNQERQILEAAASGVSLREVARQTGIAVTTVRRLYAEAMERIEGETIEEFTAAMVHRLGVLLGAAWEPAMEGSPESQRVALKVTQELSKLKGAYPAVQIEADLTVQVTRRVTITQAASHLAEIREAKMRSEAIDVPSTNGSMNGHSTNGHIELAS
jgi:DNA-binding CsgD family transcriptional regulator